MAPEEKELLIRNLLFFRSRKHKEFAGDDLTSRKSEEILNTIELMIREGKIKNFLSLESVYCYCMEQWETEPSKLDKYAREIVEFLN